MRACSLLFGALPASANFIAPKFDATVFVFALVISLATGFLFGIIPAFKASRASVAEALKEEARTSGKKPEEGHPRKRAAGRPGGIFVSPAGDGGACSCEASGGPTRSTRVSRPRIWPSS